MLICNWACHRLGFPFPYRWGRASKLEVSILILTIICPKILQGRHLCVPIHISANPRVLVLCSYFPKHHVHRMAIIMYFQYSTSTAPSKKRKKRGKSFYLKIIFIQSLLYIDDFTWIKTEINIKNANVAIGWN